MPRKPAACHPTATNVALAAAFSYAGWSNSRTTDEGFLWQERGDHRRRHRHGPPTGPAVGRRGLQCSDVRSSASAMAVTRSRFARPRRAAGGSGQHPSRRDVPRRRSGRAFPARGGQRAGHPTRSTYRSTTPAWAAAAVSWQTSAVIGRGRSTSAGAVSISTPAPFSLMLINASEGHIVNTSSVNGFWASIGPNIPHTAHCAAKFAVKGFSEALMTDLKVNAPHVRCSVVMLATSAPRSSPTRARSKADRVSGRDERSGTGASAQADGWPRRRWRQSYR